MFKFQVFYLEKYIRNETTVYKISEGRHAEILLTVCYVSRDKNLFKNTVVLTCAISSSILSFQIVFLPDAICKRNPLSKLSNPI